MKPQHRHRIFMLLMCAAAATAGWVAGRPASGPQQTDAHAPAATSVNPAAGAGGKPLTEPMPGTSDAGKLLDWLDGMSAAQLGARAEQLVRSGGDRELLAAIVERWAAQAPHDAWQFYRRFPVPGLAGPVTAHLCLADPAAAMRARLQEWLPADGRDMDDGYWKIFDAIADSLSRRPAAESAVLMKEHGFAIPWSVAKRIAMREPAAAGDYVDSLPHGRSRDMAKDWLIDAAMHTDPKAVLDWALEGNAEMDKIGDHWRDWRKRDPAAALAWLMGKKEERGLLAAHARDLGELTSGKGAQAVIEAAGSLSGRSRFRMLAGAADQLSRSDVPAALTLADAMPESTLRRQTVAGIVSNWTDRIAATAWTQQLPDPSYRLHCLTGIAGTLQNDPAAVEAWAATLSPENLTALKAAMTDVPDDELKSWQITLKKIGAR